MYDKACTMQNTANIKNKYQKKTAEILIISITLIINLFKGMAIFQLETLIFPF